MKHLFVIIILFAVGTHALGQPLYFTRNGQISFFSKTPMENIDAVNNEVFSLIDVKKGEIAFAVLIKGFRFERALMEEHFNENYMESTKFPKATFNGKIANINSVAFDKDGTYPVNVDGDLTIHGVTHQVSTEGKIVVLAGKVSTAANFTVKVKDYDIEIPSIVADKIEETIKVAVACSYELKESK